MSKLSRRSLVAGAGALATSAIPAVASNIVAILSADPIFAAIMGTQRAHDCVADAVASLGRAEVAFLEQFGTMTPDAFSKVCREEMAKILPSFADCCTDTHEKIERCRGRFPDTAVDFFHDELDHQTATYAVTVKPWHDELTRAWDAYDEAFDALISTVPTSAAGIDVMLEYIRDNETASGSLDGPECLTTFLTTIKGAVANLVGSA
jgi:hypothetical protein